MKIKPYDRNLACIYAQKWAFTRNPKYYNYDAIGGDCTNFVSQCIYAGSNVMNYNKTNGWYYIDSNQKSPSWTGVEFLYNFLINNSGVGPSGLNVNSSKIELGDITQLSFSGKKFEHSLIIVRIEDSLDFSKIYTASHTLDSYARALNSYKFNKIRFVHIESIKISQ